MIVILSSRMCQGRNAFQGEFLADTRPSLIHRYRLEYESPSRQNKELALLEEDDKFYKNFTYYIQKHKDFLRLVYTST